METVICLSYHYPPFGGVAVQRVLRFSRYFHEFGFRCVVICAHPPKATSIPLDPQLLEDIPSQVEVHRLHTFEPECLHNHWSHPWDKIRRNFLKTFAAMLIPDDQALWIGPAARKAVELAARYRARALWATGPPFSSLLAGAKASRSSGVPLVADFRDDWTGLGILQERLSSGRLAKERALEQGLFRQARAVVTVTPGLVSDLSARSPYPERIHMLPNGFDPAHFSSAPPAASVGPKVIFYAGSLYPRREPGGLFQGWELLRQRSPELAAQLRFELAGPVSQDCRYYFEPSPPGVQHLGFLPHIEVRQRLQTAAANLVWLDPYISQQAYSGKLLEYFGVGRPILLLGPQGNPAAELLKESGLGVSLECGDAVGIAEALARLAQDQWECKPNLELIGRFDVRKQTRELVDLFLKL